MIPVYLFTDYRGQFYSSSRSRGASVDLGLLRSYFAERGFSLNVMPIAKIDFSVDDYKDVWVLFQSSEDPGLSYRSYIDDIVLGLHLQGARLIPPYAYFHAHHNKHFLEILREMHSSKAIKNLKSFRFGTYEDYLRNIDTFGNLPFVLKSSDTAKSRGVFLMNSSREKLRLPKAVSSTLSFQNLKYFLATLVTGKRHLYISNHRRKFIVQPFVGGLSGDYRVIIYGEKTYVLRRLNRPKDFRASGSMRFSYPERPPEGLLDYSQKVFKDFDVPFIALDIGVRDKSFFLFEFQFLSFGQYTLEKSSFYFTKEPEGDWARITETPVLEGEIAASVSDFIKTHS